jgi:hypothetical protein
MLSNDGKREVCFLTSLKMSQTDNEVPTANHDKKKKKAGDTVLDEGIP